MHCAPESCGGPPEVDRLLEDLRTLDLLGPTDLARVLPEIEHARARLCA